MSRPLPLPSQKYLRECFDYEPETGKLLWRHRPLAHFHHTRTRKAESYQRAWNAAFAARLVGYASPDGYIVVCLNDRKHQVARVIFKLMTGDEPPQVDHKDRDRSNNRWDNLRGANAAQNKANSGVSARNQCGWKGVNAQRGKFYARIFADGRFKHLGSFATPEEAHAAYCAAASARWGEFFSAH
jgi:hypothetical protein